MDIELEEIADERRVEEDEEVVEERTPNILVRGIVRGGREDIVHLEVDGRYRRANRGDDIEGFILVDILKDGIILQKDERLLMFNIR